LHLDALARLDGRVKEWTLSIVVSIAGETGAGAAATAAGSLSWSATVADCTQKRIPIGIRLQAQSEDYFADSCLEVIPRSAYHVGERKTRHRDAVMPFADRLKELRKAKGLTQDALSRAAGLAHSTVPKLEQGGITPGWDTVVALADALGVSLDDFRDKPADASRPATKAKKGKAK
jgi:DNA-binding XRE family transcriptional regulator